MTHRQTVLFARLIILLMFGVFMLLAIERSFATAVAHPSSVLTTMPSGVVVIPDTSKHIIIGTEVLVYIKVFCWVVGAMFFVLSSVAAGLGWFMKRTLDKLDGTNDKQWTEIIKTRADMDTIMSEHNLRGKLCPGLRPDLLKSVVASVLGISLPNETVHPHRRCTDPTKCQYEHFRQHATPEQLAIFEASMAEQDDGTPV